MAENAIFGGDDGELSDEDLDVVIGGLEHVWTGALDPAEFGPPLAAAGGDAPRNRTA